VHCADAPGPQQPESQSHRFSLLHLFDAFDPSMA